MRYRRRDSLAGIVTVCLAAAVLCAACASGDAAESPRIATPGVHSTPAGVTYSAEGVHVEPAEGATEVQDEVDAPSTTRFRSPVSDGTAIGDRFGVSRGQGLMHAGIDFVLRTREEAVLAPCTGRVSQVQVGPPASVVVDCGDGWEAALSSLDAFSVAADDALVEGALVGHAGTSSSFVHFEIHWQGSPVDPVRYLPAPAQQPAPGEARQPARTPTVRPTPVSPTPDSGSAPPTADGRSSSTPAPATPTRTQAAPTPTATPVPPTPTPTPTPRPSRANP